MLVAQYTRTDFGSDVQAMSQAAFEEATGVRIKWVALAAGGGMIDLRYQTLDPDKALVVHDDDTPPTVIDEASGIALSRPWMDHDHFGDPHTAVSYNALLVNSGGVIKRGATVTVVIGKSRLTGIPVY